MKNSITPALPECSDKPVDSPAAAAHVDMAHAKLIVMGEITTVDDDGEMTVPMGLLLQFDSVEAIRRAIQDGRCAFEFK